MDTNSTESVSINEKGLGKTSTQTACSSSSLLDAVKEKALLRKVDLHVLPMLCLMSMVTFLDRVNISSALTLGLPEDLGLVGEQPNVALLVFFVPYLVFEIPSNILAKKLKPNVWIAACITFFGVITLASGFVQNYAGLLTVRVLLGFAEAGALPGSLYVLSFWYTRGEAQRRFTFFWSAVVLAGAFGGLIATGLAKLGGAGGLVSWRWIFVIEGIITIFIGVAGFLYLPDFPGRATWLNAEEKEMVNARVHDDVADAAPTTLNDIGRFFKKPHGIIASLMYFSILYPIYCFSYFTPTIVQGMGYSHVQTQLHSVSPYVASLALCWIMAFISDRYKLRFPFVLFGQFIALVGLAILLAAHGRQDNYSLQYAGIHLVLMGAFGAGGGVLCWCLMNFHGHVERGIGSGWVVAFGNSSGIVATFSFLKADAPAYHTGYSLAMGITVMGVLATVTYTLLVLRDRRRAAPGAIGTPTL